MSASRMGDQGFTLVELLVAITILGIITTALGTALYVGIRASGDEQRSLDESNAEQLVAYFLSNDVRSACSSAVTVPSCTRSPNPSTSPVTACGATVQVAIDTTSTATGAAADTTIGYVLTGTTLTRVTCAFGSSSAYSSRIIAQYVGSVVGSYPASGSCAGQFQLAVTITGSTQGNGTSDFPFAVCAHRRVG
jgi:prepilin-type N-terminal cleavage/methylation domain-containing protein